MKAFRRTLVISLSFVTLVGAAIGIYYTIHSPLFTVQVVEVIDQPERAPVDAEEITRLAAVPIGKISLFELDLGVIERRILENSWVKAVYLNKRFPQALSISVTFREPRALWQGRNGDLAYVDQEGAIFGKISLEYQPDLPILSGFLGDDRFRVLDALHLLSAWQNSPMRGAGEISSLFWDPERGFRAWIVYPLGQFPASKGRVLVDLGQEPDDELNLQLRRLSKVMTYLSSHMIAARQIWADTGKKIVVKTAKGS